MYIDGNTSGDNKEYINTCPTDDKAFKELLDKAENLQRELSSVLNEISNYKFRFTFTWERQGR